VALLLSASQLQLLTECQRKWGFRYLEKLRTPQHPSAALGQEVHEKQLGPYLTQGKAFDFTRPSGEIAQALVPLLPLPGTPGLHLERRFEIPSPSGKFSYQGYIDLYAPNSTCVPGIERSSLNDLSPSPLIGDFKTTSNLAYAKTSEGLATDIQAQLYSWALMVEERANEIDLVWFYTRTRKPHKAQRVHLHVYKSHVDEQFERIDEIGRRVEAIKTASPAVEDLPPNVRMCEQYGGCPYRYKCNIAPPAFARAQEKGTSMNSMTNDFLAKLRKATAPTADAHPVAPQSPPPAAVKQVDMFESSEVQLPAWATSPVDPLTAKKAPAPVVMPAINPPESALPPAPPTGVAAPSETSETQKKRGRPRKEATITESIQQALTEPVHPLPGSFEDFTERLRRCGVKKLQMPTTEVDGITFWSIELA